MTRRLTKTQRQRMRQTLYELQGHRCCYCQRFVYLDYDHGDQTATLEHLKRLKDGGDDSRDNLALACHRCNSSRGELSWVEFATLMRPASNDNFARLQVIGEIR